MSERRYVLDDGCCPHGALHVCPKPDCGDHYIAGYQAAESSLRARLAAEVRAITAGRGGRVEHGGGDYTFVIGSVDEFERAVLQVIAPESET